MHSTETLWVPHWFGIKLCLSFHSRKTKPSDISNLKTHRFPLPSAWLPNAVTAALECWIHGVFLSQSLRLHQVGINEAGFIYNIWSGSTFDGTCMLNEALWKTWRTCLSPKKLYQAGISFCAYTKRSRDLFLLSNIAHKVHSPCNLYISSSIRTLIPYLLWNLLL